MKPMIAACSPLRKKWKAANGPAYSSQWIRLSVNLSFTNNLFQNKTPWAFFQAWLTSYRQFCCIDTRVIKSLIHRKCWFDESDKNLLQHQDQTYLVLEKCTSCPLNVRVSPATDWTSNDQESHILSNILKCSRRKADTLFEANYYGIVFAEDTVRDQQIYQKRASRRFGPKKLSKLALWYYIFDKFVFPQMFTWQLG